MKLKLIIIGLLLSALIVVAGCGLTLGKSIAGQAVGRGVDRSFGGNEELINTRTQIESQPSVSQEVASLSQMTVEICDNDKDDDKDGKIDCKDAGCSSSTDCGPIELDACNPYYVWEEGATYRLVGDVSSTESCFNINAKDVTLDCNGYTITGPSASIKSLSGILISSSGVIVQNCGVGGYNSGIQVLSDNVIVQGNKVSLTSAGIEVSGSSILIMDNIIDSSDFGLVLSKGSSIFQGNYVCGNTKDISCQYLDTTSTSTGKGNTFGSVGQCPNAWPQMPKNYNKCPKN